MSHRTRRAIAAILITLGLAGSAAAAAATTGGGAQSVALYYHGLW